MFVLIYVPISLGAPCFLLSLQFNTLPVLCRLLIQLTAVSVQKPEVRYSSVGLQLSVYLSTVLHPVTLPPLSAQLYLRYIAANFDIHMSVHLNVVPNYKQQDATLHNVFISTDALHVSDGSSAHHQEHISVHTASGIVNQYCC